MGLQMIHRSLSKRKVETQRHQQAEQVRHVCIPRVLVYKTEQ